MSFPYQKLLSPYPLTENILLKNRIVSPNVLRAHNQGPETWPADPQFAECAQLCNAGASLLSYRHTGRFGGGARHHEDLRRRRAGGRDRSRFDSKQTSV